MNASIGIIGGADGPTAVFVATGPNLPWLAGAAALAGILLWRRRKKKEEEEGKQP